MNQIEIIQREYEEFVLKSNFVKNKEEFLLFIEVGLDNLDSQLIDILKEIKINCKIKNKEKIKNIILGLFKFEDLDFFDADNKILEEIIKYINTYKQYFTKLRNIVTEENFQELTRLVDFASVYYNKHLDYFEYKRDILEYSYKGIGSSKKIANNFLEFDEFFNKEIAKYSLNKAVEKKKKMC